MSKKAYAPESSGGLSLTIANGEEVLEIDEWPFETDDAVLQEVLDRHPLVVDAVEGDSELSKDQLIEMAKARDIPYSGKTKDELREALKEDQQE